MPPPYSCLSRYRIPATSLSPDELEILELFLDLGSTHTSIRAMDQLHGFLTSVALSSPDMERERWLPLVVPDNLADLPPRLQETPPRERMTAYVLRMFDDVLFALANPDAAFLPLVGRRHDGHAVYDEGTMWSSGFLQGVAALQDEWSAFLKAPVTAALLLPIFMLGSSSLPAPWDTMVETLGQRHRLTASIPTAVDAIHLQRFALELIALKEAQAALQAARRCH